MNTFKILEQINYGKYGVVKKIIYNTTKSNNTISNKKQKITPTMVVKIIPINDNCEKIQNEIKIMKMLNHPNIVSYHDSFYNDMNYYIIMELISGEELFYYINEIKTFEETDAIQIIKKLMHILQYMHEKNIIHHDIKPENILCPDPNDLSNLVLIDFGLAVQTSTPCSNFVGTPYYMAPEIINFIPHNKSVDLYSCGIIFYLLLYNELPFNSDDRDEIFNQIRNDEPIFNINIKINEHIINLIQRMIHKNPYERPSIEMVIDILDNK